VHSQSGLAAALQRTYVRVAEARLLDRLITSKVWIALVAFALIGIVTLQLGLLELNTSIGRVLEREGSLQRQNAALSIENSEIAAGDRVETQATKLGMELVPAGALRFLRAHGGEVTRAASALATSTAPGASVQTGATAASGESAGAGESSGSGESGRAPGGGESVGEAAHASAPSGEGAASHETEASTQPSAAPGTGAAPATQGVSPSGVGTGAGGGEAAAGGTASGPTG
jgi:hypothetical protein